MKGLNVNEIIFLGWLHTDCDWDQIAWPADHDEPHPGYTDDNLFDIIIREVEWAAQWAKTESVFDEDFLSKIRVGEVADVIWRNDEYLYLNPKHSVAESKMTHGIFSGKRIHDRRVSSSSEDWGGNVGPVVEPGCSEMQEKIAHVERVVEAIAPRVKIIEVKEEVQ